MSYLFNRNCSKIVYLTTLLLYAVSQYSYAINKSIHLNAGSNTNYITLNNSSSGSVFDFGSDTFTIEVWVKPLQFSFGSNTYEHTIIGNDNQSSTGAGYVLRTGSSKKLEFAYKSASGWNVTTTPNVIFDFEKWTHIAVSKQGTLVSIYINGQLVKDSIFSSASISSSTYPVRIGENGSLNGRILKGNIDELKIWSIARTANDIKEDMAESCSPYNNKLLAYYKMDDTGTVAPSIINCHTNTTYKGILNDTVNLQPGALLIKRVSTLYVDSSNTNTACGSNAGYSWNTAFTDLNDAILAAQTYPFIENIYVAKGTYTPHIYRFEMKPSRTAQQISSTDNEDKLFHVRSGVELYGGYTSGGGVRDPYANPTILDGKGVGGVTNDTAYHVLHTDSSSYWGATNDTTIIDGFTIQHARTTSSSSLISASTVRGGALYLHGGTNVITSCIVKNSYGYNGVSGIYSNKGYDLIKNCRIEKNSDGYAFSGEYFSNGYYRNATLLNDTFVYNTSGAMRIESRTQVLSCIITNNTASGTPGINVSGSTHLIKDCQIKYNRTTQYSTLTGGGISFSQTYADSVINNEIIGNYCGPSQGGGVFFIGGNGHTVVGNLIMNDTAKLGGGICAQNTHIACYNNTIISNYATASGGGIYSGSNNTELVGNIIDGNISAQSSGGIHLFGTKAYIAGNTISNNSDSTYCGGLSFVTDTVRMYNNVIANNKGAIHGGVAANTNRLIFCNNTIYGNAMIYPFSQRAGGLFISNRGSHSIYNNIFWNNRLTSNNVQGADIYISNNVRTFKNNILQLTSNNYTTTGTGAYDLGAGASGNIFFQYPTFLDTINLAGNDGTFNTTDDGLQIGLNSPALNTGDSSLLTDTLYIDIISADRITGTNIDIGAFETNCTPVNISSNSASNICSGSSTTLTIGTPLASSSVKWYEDSTTLTVLSTGIQYTTPALTTTDTFWVSVTGCNNNTRVPIIARVNKDSSTLQNTSVTQTGCRGYSTTLSVSGNINEEQVYWYSDNSQNILLDSGYTYTTPPVFATDTFWVVAKGCIDTISLPVNVTTYPSTGSNTDTAICNSFYWHATAQQYYSSGKYYDTSVNTYGCIHIDTLTLTIKQPSYNTNNNITACGNYTWSANNVTYVTSGIYYDTLINAVGCDSFLKINLVIQQPSYDSSSITACDRYTWPVTGTKYTTSGIYRDTLTNTVGCDSILIINLTIKQAQQASINQSSNILTALPAGVNGYQWINCSDNKPITNATSPTYTATTNGQFAVIISDNGCNDTSICVTVSGVNVETFNTISGINISPNPANEYVYVRTGNVTAASIKVFDITGKLINEIIPYNSLTSINVQNYTRGVYTLHVLLNDKIVIRRFNVL